MTVTGTGRQRPCLASKRFGLYVKGKKEPWKISRRKTLLDWHFKTVLLGNQSDTLECTLDSEQGDWGFSPLCHHQLCVSG